MAAAAALIWIIIITGSAGRTNEQCEVESGQVFALDGDEGDRGRKQWEKK